VEGAVVGGLVADEERELLLLLFEGWFFVGGALIL
jgi:hypothetical protein